MPRRTDEPFVARGPELDAISAAFARAAGGEGGIAVLVGEPGGGKTRLVEEAIRVFARARPAVGWGRASEDAVVSYWPWRQVFRGLDIPLVLPDLAAGVPAGDEGSRRLEVAEDAVAALRRAASARSVVIALDDMQWADAASLHLLRRLAAEIGETRLLVLVTGRDGPPGTPFADTLAGLVGRPAVRMLRLPPLTAADVARYMGAPAGDAAVAWVHGQSGGNPLYVRELNRTLADDPVVPGAPPTAVPLELRALIIHRLSHLDGACRSLVDGASVVGDDVDLGLLAAVVGPIAPEALDAAIAEGVLRRSPDFPGRVGFTHGLVRSAVYAELPSSVRTSVHRMAADALEARGAADDEERIAELARHRLRGAVTEADRRQAVERLRQAAAVATRRLAFDDAARLLEQAATAAGLDPLPEPERAEIEVELAAALFRAGRVQTAVEQSSRAVDMAERAGRPDLMAAGALVVTGVGEPQRLRTLLDLKERVLARIEGPAGAARIRLEAQVAALRAELGRIDKAEQPSRAALAAADELGDPEALFDAIRARQVVCSGPDGVVERLALGTRMIELGAGPDPGLAAMWGRLWRIDAALQLGNLDQVLWERAELEALVRRLGFRLAEWHLTMVNAGVAVTTGRLEEALGLALEARRQGESLEDESAVGITFAITAELERLWGRDIEMAARVAWLDRVPLPIVKATFVPVLHALGDVDGARRLYEQVAFLIDDLPRDGRWLPTVCALARGSCLLDDGQHAARGYAALAPYGASCIAGGAGALMCQGSVSSLLGRLAAQLGRPDDAARHFAAGVTVGRRIGALPYLAEVLWWWADLVAGSDPVHARALAEESLGIARALGLGPTLRSAEGVLARVGRAPDLLTRREREVAGLVAEGLSNREIATTLFLSERTVETHVSRILGKLSLGTRTQLAAWTLTRR